MAGALDGIRVVDFGQFVAGPLAAVLLADNGAEVIHVDPPGGPRWPGPADAFYNRGKRRVTLDLTRADDLAIARDLIAGADVVIENFRTGVMDRLGVGAEAMTAADPALVYCSLPAFAPDDRRAAVAGWEGVVQAATAGYRPLGEHWDHTARGHITVDDDQRPLFTAIPVASNFAAFLGATGIVMALIARERTGHGQRVEVPLADAMAEAYSMFLAFRVYRDAPPTASYPISELSYPCADGRFFDCTPYPRFVLRFLEGAGVAREWQDAGLVDIQRCRFDQGQRAQTQARFAELMRTRPAREWEELAIALGLPFAMVRTPAEWLTTPHARESQTVVRLDDPELGETWMAGLAVHLSETPGGARPRHLPDADHDAVVAELRERRAERRRPSPSEPDLARPLQGLKVIDLTQVVAGPTAGRLLADFGADVVKINNPRPSPTDGIVGHLHRGKRTMLLDVQDDDGRAVLWRLVEDADVVLQNFAMGAAERYGFGYEQVQARKPDVVYASISAFAYAGPWGGRRGYENQGNAATGLSFRYGGARGWPIYQPHLVNDAGTGVIGAFAVGLGVFHRYRTGRGQHVATSLSQSSTLHQAAYLIGHEGKRWDEPSGVDARGWSAWQRLYRAADGWFFLGVGPGQHQRLGDVEGLADLADDVGSAADPDGPLARALTQRFASRSHVEWCARLQAAGIGAHPVATLDEAAAILAERGVVTYEPGPAGDLVPTPSVGAWLSATPPRAGANPGAMGSQAEDILRRIGMAERIEELTARGVIRIPKEPPVLLV